MRTLDITDGSRFLVLRLALDAYSQSQHKEARELLRSRTHSPETRERLARGAESRRDTAERLLADMSHPDEAAPDAWSAMLARIRAYNDRLNSGDDPQAPTGDDYNAILDLLEIRP